MRVRVRRRKRYPKVQAAKYRNSESYWYRMSQRRLYGKVKLFRTLYGNV